MRIGALEFGESSGQLPTETISQVLDRAVAYEDMGLERIWFGEHHSPSIAWSYPEPLVATTVAMTKRVRVGTGCILLRYRNPYRLACDFRALSTLNPGRVELGVGSGVVARDVARQVAVAEDKENDYGDKLRHLERYMRAGSRSSAPFRHLYPTPVGGTNPSLWVMGSTAETARVAAEMGASLCCSLFTPSRPCTYGNFAQYYDTAARVGMSGRHALALAAAWTRAGVCESTTLGLQMKLSYVGTSLGFADWLRELWEEYKHPEILILNQTYDHQRILESWHELTEELGLGLENGRGWS